MSAPMKLKHEVDNVSQTTLVNILDHIDLELFLILSAQVRSKISAQINFVDDRIAEQLK